MQPARALRLAAAVRSPNAPFSKVRDASGALTDGKIDRAAHVVGIDIFECHRLFFGDDRFGAADSSLDQRVHFFAAPRSAPEMAHPEHITGPQDHSLEAALDAVGFQNQFLRRF